MYLRLRPKTFLGLVEFSALILALCVARVFVETRVCSLSLQSLAVYALGSFITVQVIVAYLRWALRFGSKASEHEVEEYKILFQNVAIFGFFALLFGIAMTIESTTRSTLALSMLFFGIENVVLGALLLSNLFMLRYEGRGLKSILDDQTNDFYDEEY